MITATKDRYSAPAQLFHWATVILVLAAYLLSEGGPETRVYSAAADSGRRLHETLGLAVFFLVLVRLLWRLIDQQPAEPPMPRWMLIASRLTHGLLYLLLVAVPLSAILGAWLEGHPLTLLVGDIPSLIAASHDIGGTITDLHTTLGNVILWIAGLHAAAALYHHFVLRDSVLASMLPGSRG